MRRLGAVLVIVVVGILFWARNTMFSSSWDYTFRGCTVTTLSALPSPSGRVKAVAYDQVCDDHRPRTSNIAVLDPDDSLEGWDHDVLTLLNGPGASDSTLARFVPFDYIWLSDSMIGVRIPRNITIGWVSMRRGVRARVIKTDSLATEPQ